MSEAVAYAIEIGRALSCAHAQPARAPGHQAPERAARPTTGRAKVTDFGIARSLEVDGLTAAGRVLGTTDYVSPEQALGHEVTQQSDIYSLGIVLYEMLTGERPFRAETQVAVAMKHVKEPLPDVHGPAARDLGRAGLGGRRATSKETRNRYADDRTRWCTTWSRRWPSRPRAPERPAARPPPILRSLPADTADFAPGGCATRAAPWCSRAAHRAGGRRDRLPRHPHREGRRRLA